MPTLGQLYVELKATVDPFIADMKRAQKEANETTKYLKPMQETFEEIGTGMTVVGGAIVGAFAAATIATANYGDQLHAMEQRTGVASDQLSKLAYAAKISNVETDVFAKGLTILTKNANAAANGSKAQADAFAELGIKVTGADGQLRPMNDLLLDVADKFKKMEDGTEKAAAAQEIFGKSGGALIPLLDEGREGIARLGDEAARLGLVMGSDAAAQGDEFNDTLDALKGSVEGVGIAVGTVFLPVLTDLMKQATEVTIAIRQFAEAHPGVIKVVGELAVVIFGAGGLFLGLSAVLTILPGITTAVGLLGTAITFLTGPVGLAVAAVGALTLGLKYLWDTHKTVKEATENYTASEKKAIESLKQHGIELNLTGLNEAQRTEAIAAASRSLVKQTDTTKEATSTLRKHVDKVAEAKAAEQAHKAAIEATKLALDNQKIGLELVDNVQKNYTENLKSATSHTWLLDEATLQLAADAAGKAATDLGSWNATVATAVANLDQASYNTQQAQKDFDSLNKKMPEISLSIDDVGTGVLDVANNYDKMSQAAKDNADALKAATDDVKKSAGKVFDDLLAGGKNVFSDLGTMLKGGALSLGRSIFEDITGALLGPVKKAFDDFFTGLLESTGIKKFITGLGDRVGGALSGLIGGGTSAASSAAGGIGGTATRAGGAASSIGTAASGASTAATFAASAIGGVISGVISAIGSARQEGTLNAIEFNTRSTYIEIKDMMDSQMNAVLFTLGVMNQALGFINAAVDISNGYLASLEHLATNGAVVTGAPASNVPKYATGTPRVRENQLAFVHKDERIIDAKSNDQLIPLLQAILHAVQGGLTVVLDGKNMARALAPHFYKITRDESVVLIGVR